MKIKSATATDVAKHFGAWIDAAKSGPVKVTKHDRTAAWLVSPEDYERLTGARRAVKAEDMDDEWLAAIAAARVPPEEDYETPDFED